MTPETRKQVFDYLEAEERKLLRSKGLDYAGENDVLSNFKNNAYRLGLSKYQVWAVYFMKHIDAISNSIPRGAEVPMLASESWESRIMDARNYLGLLVCMLREDMDQGHRLSVDGKVLSVKPYQAVPCNDPKSVDLLD